MSKILVIPDVHLKPWMFEQATDIMENTDVDNAVFLGDLVDDWHMQSNVELYRETLDAAIDFAVHYPHSLWCYGNHDLSYLWNQYDHPGYSFAAADLVCNKFEELRDVLTEPENLGIMHRVDRVLFSHAGLSTEFVEAQLHQYMDDIDCMIDMINEYGYEELWEDNSPIWARPQDGTLAKGMFAPEFLQVVGHTPVEEILVQDKLITADTFSTSSTGHYIGNREFIWVDTKEMTWSYFN